MKRRNTMVKWHVTITNRVMQCNKPESCPIGVYTPHFNTKEEAEAFKEETKAYNDNEKIIEELILGKGPFPPFRRGGETKNILQRGDFDGFKNVYRVEIYRKDEENPQDYVAYYDSDGNVEDFTIKEGIFSEVEEKVHDISDAIIKMVKKGDRVPCKVIEKTQKEENAKAVTYNDLMETNHKISELEAKIDILIEKVDTLTKLQKP